MPLYTFYLHENGDAVPAFEIAHFDDLAEAKVYGQRLLTERLRYHFVEITEGEAPVATLPRTPSFGGTNSEDSSG